MQKKDFREDEINFLPLISQTKQIIIKSYHGAKGTLELALRRILLLAVFCFIGILAGWALFKSSKPIYKSEVLLYSNYLNNDYCFQLIGTLEDLVKEQNCDEISEKLEVSTHMATKIKSISYKNFNPKFQKLYKDSIALAVPFKIEVLTEDNEILDSLEIGLVSYLENNKFALLRKEVRQHQLEQMQGKLQQEQIKIDSLKTIIKESIIPRGTGTGLIYGEPINPVEIYKEAINLYDKELDIYQELALLKNIELVEGFTSFNKPHSPKLLLNVIVGFFIGFLLGLLVAYMYERKKEQA
jgi:hypothetical protein